MSIRTCGRGLWLGLLLALPLAGDGPAAEEVDEAHEALRAFRLVYERAVNEDRVDLLAPYLDTEFSGVVMTNDPVTGFAGLKRHWEAVRKLRGDGGSYDVVFRPEKSFVLGDLTLTYGSTSDQVRTGDGREFRYSTNWTALFRRTGRDWKLLRAHASMDPRDNAFIRAGVRDLAWKLGGGAFLAGAVVGVFAGRAFAR